MELNKRVASSKKNQYELNNFINDYKPFIAGVVQKHVGRFVQYGVDDELSIGMLAFEEAVRSFNEEKGAFLSFAETVINRRLIDYSRKEGRHSNVIPLSSFQKDGEEINIDITEKQSIQEFQMGEAREYRKYEIAELQKELKEWGISFFELPEVSPKHQETREIYKDIVNTVIRRPELLNMLKVKKYLPIAEIEKETGIHRKKIERARKYVIAMILILTGEYKYIQDFINWR